MKTFPASELMQWRLERQEDIYESSKREPLGKSYNRGHVLPEGMGTERPFGKAEEEVRVDHVCVAYRRVLGNAVRVEHIRLTPRVVLKARSCLSID